MALNFEQLSIGEVVVSGKGAKSASFQYGKDPVIWLPAASMTVAYEPGVFSGEDVSRVNLCLRPPEDIQDQLSRLDGFVVSFVAANSERLLGKALTEEQALARYQPTLRISEKGYAPTMKCKMNVSGKNVCRVWQGKQSREPPETWAGASVSVRLWLKSLYIMGANFGCTIDVTDVSINQEATRDCPF